MKKKVKKTKVSRKKTSKHKPSKVKKNKSLLKDKAFLIPIRYIILLAFVFSLPIVYKIFTPLTIYPTAYLLKIFYNVAIHSNIITIEYTTFIQIIPACVAGSAYLLLLIINLTVPMGWKKRINSILCSFLILLILNILRIFILSIMYHESVPYFDFTHKLFWYALSTVFVVGIWFYMVKKFKIKEIPVYTDFNFFIKNIKKK
ncbi:MAG: pacearchaeosortase [archaeon]